jgi:CBS domain-containing protein
MRAVDVMTTAVVSVKPDASVAEVARLLRERCINVVPVIDDSENLVGIVSEGDLLRLARPPRWLEFLAPRSQLDACVKDHSKRVKDVMTRNVVTVPEDAPLAAVTDLLETNRVKRLPVVRDGKVVGIISRSDVLQAIASGADTAGALSPKDDGAIRHAIVNELRKQKWADPTEPEIVVNGGVVHLWGFFMSEAERQALLVAAENVAGVRAVHDHVRELQAFYNEF